MKQFFLSLLTIAALTACEYYEPYVPAIHGQASPIQLKAGRTAVFLSDYFHQTTPDSVQWPAGLAVMTTDSGVVWLEDQPEAYLSTAAFYLNGLRYDIPVYASTAQEVTISFSKYASAQKVHLFGSFNAWNREALPMQRTSDGWQISLRLEPGQYEYKLMVDGVEKSDPANPDSVSNGMGSFNSLLKIAPEGEAPILVYADSHGKNFVSLSPLPEDQTLVALWENHLIQARPSYENGMVVYNLPIPNPAFRGQRSHLRVFTARNGQKGNDLLIPLQQGQVIENPKELSRSDWPTSIMYFMMIDRFANGDTTNDQPVADPMIHPKANYYGGDLAGVRQKINDGFFDELGVNTIWVSPISKNPLDAWGLWDKGGVTTKFSGYHGYWPVSNVLPDPRFGKSDVVQGMLDDAHGRNMNVLLDYVANHVHQSHPVYQKNPDWATPLYLPDGTLNTEKWDEHRLTTWFDTFMPTLDLRKQEIVDPMTDSALVWVLQYDFDGFRHDATKHIAERYWRTLTAKLKDSLPEKHIYQIGETYGSPDLIASYVGSGMLDAQFDFNVYDAAVSAFSGTEDAIPALQRLVEKEQQSLAYYGHHNLMGYISGNQDRSRFISIASGDVLLSEDQKLAGWTRDIPLPNDTAYQRLGLLHAFNFGIPGIPVIYYGDEFGLHGAGDPDNRKMMRFDQYSDAENALRNKVKQLVALRKEHLALTYGTTELEVLPNGLLKIRRVYFDDEVLIFLNATHQSQEIALEGSWQSAFGLSTSEATLQIPAYTFEYLTKP